MSGDRDKGNPNSTTPRRQAGRVGFSLPFSELPNQAACISANALPSDTVASYTIGKPTRPMIIHDDGFLALGTRDASLADRAKLAKWRALLEGAEALRSDLTDATAAYRHFLDGDGAPRIFSYERFMLNDSSGQSIVHNALMDVQRAILRLWHSLLLTPGRTSITGSAIPCGAPSDVMFPYPATENWQKAIGAHTIWLSADVDAPSGTKRGPLGLPSGNFRATITLHAEDRYNFNPGANDIVTGIPDEDNGIFEMTGLAKQYDQFAELVRVVEFSESDDAVCAVTAPPSSRARQPTTNRRLRNRI